MKIQTISIVVGSTSCNAKCPYCISCLTPIQEVDKQREINVRNFRKLCRLGQINNVTTILLTGKGEPTLYPEQITEHLKILSPYEFPFIELQTNGIELGKKASNSLLRGWYNQGLTTVILSTVSVYRDTNQNIFGTKEYPDITELVEKFHKFGFSVRLSATLMTGFEGCVDSVNEILNYIEFARELKVEQVTVRPMAVPEINKATGVYKWAYRHQISPSRIKEISTHFTAKHPLLMELMHGAKVYDVDGQNFCLSTCLTESPDPEKMRQVIFFPDGHVRYSWQYEGAILL